MNFGLGPYAGMKEFVYDAIRRTVERRQPFLSEGVVTRRRSGLIRPTATPVS